MNNLWSVLFHVLIVQVVLKTTNSINFNVPRFSAPKFSAPKLSLPDFPKISEYNPRISLHTPEMVHLPVLNSETVFLKQLDTLLSNKYLHENKHKDLENVDENLGRLTDSDQIREESTNRLKNIFKELTDEIEESRRQFLKTKHKNSTLTENIYKTLSMNHSYHDVPITENDKYHYKSREHITFASSSKETHLYPAYHGNPPAYIYLYIQSDSKYGVLLAGLALLNLATLEVIGDFGREIKPHKSAVSRNINCKFGVRNDKSDYEEVGIDCNLTTSFIFEKFSAEDNNGNVDTTLTETRIYNKRVPNALDVKGEPIRVNSGMQCFVIWKFLIYEKKKMLECGLLQSYADQSFEINSGLVKIPKFTVWSTSIILLVNHHSII